MLEQQNIENKLRFPASLLSLKSAYVDQIVTIVSYSLPPACPTLALGSDSRHFIAQSRRFYRTT